MGEGFEGKLVPCIHTVTEFRNRQIAGDGLDGSCQEEGFFRAPSLRSVRAQKALLLPPVWLVLLWAVTELSDSANLANLMSFNKYVYSHD